MMQTRMDSERECVGSGSRCKRASGPLAGAGRRLGLERARGFTLIEVLVALVVLLLGVYGMVRIFPRGYSAIEATEQRTVAAQLAEDEITRWKLHPESLPDAIVATGYEGNLILGTLFGNTATFQPLHVYGERAAFLPGSEAYEVLQLTDDQLGRLDAISPALVYRPTDLTPSQFDTALRLNKVTVHPNWQPNSLYLPRTVIGERIDIRRLGRTSLGVPFYLVSHPPLDPLRYEDDPATPAYDPGPAHSVWVDIYDARPWRYPGPDTAAAELGEREFSVQEEVQGAALYFGPAAAPPDYPRAFKVDYTDPQTMRRVLGSTVTVTAVNAGPGTPALPTGVDPRTIQVYERLRPVTDRGLLAVVDATAQRNIYYVDAQTTISGRIEFPLVLQLDPRPTDITTVKVDYRVKDWQILVFDVEVPADGVVELPVRNLKGSGYNNPPRQQRPQEVARGVRRFYDLAGNLQAIPGSDPVTWAAVVAVDTQSGEILTDNETVEWPTNPYTRRTRFRVNYRDGLLYFNYHPWEPGVSETFDPTIDTPDRSGRTFRVFCRAQADWAVQPMIAVRQYARSATRMPGGPPAPGTALGTVRLTYAWSPNNRRQLFFPLSEAGQAVAVDYYYEKWGRLFYVDGEVHTIAGPRVRDLGAWVCPLSEELSQRPNAWGPVGVRGIGVRARAVWVTQGRQATLQDVVSAVATGGRARPSLTESWHQEIISTYLTGTPL
jgi:prepilin-type N-terminal cleavage/methylation domain-containing protein